MVVIKRVPYAESLKVVEAFARLGSSAHVENGVSGMFELYMCRLYLPSVQIATVKELH